MIRYLHIPKTAGTAMKSSIRSLAEPPFTMEAKHTVTLWNVKSGQVGFVLRDPMDRFCSAFWECFTKNIQKPPRAYEEYESKIFAQIKTPDELVSELQVNNNLFKYFTDVNRIPSDGGLFKTAGSYQYWIGRLQGYKNLENRVAQVINTNSVTSALKNLYELDITTDPKLARTHKRYGGDRSYYIGPDNQKWFQEVFRPVDYELMEYIKTRDYYYEDYTDTSAERHNTYN